MSGEITTVVSKTSSDDEVVLTEPEVRQLLRLSKITLLRMRQREDRGGLPFVQLSPGRIGYLRGDLRAFLAARRVGSLSNKQAAA
jgi:hypothetical protein